MNRRRLLFRVVPIAIAIVVVFMQFFSAEKFTNDAGHTARVALDPQQEQALGLQSYAEVLQQSEVISSGEEYERVRRVANRLAAATGDTGQGFEWAVSLVRDKQVNAFCLPGGKIVVFTGILPVAKSDAGLAAVMGHEMAHATLRHGSERLFQQKATQTIMTGVQVSISDMSYDQRRAVMGAIGAGAQYGLLMPFGRDHEKEADAVGIMYMARAGYDPREAIGFWQRMGEAGGSGGPPEFMSTHPSHGTRIEQLEALMPEALAIYEKAKRQRQ